MCNVGGIDRILRVIVGLAVLSLVFIGPQTPWGWVGLIPLVTGAFSFCPLYPYWALRPAQLKTNLRFW